MRIPALLAVLVLVSACHVYVPLPTATAQHGQRVRVMLTDQGTVNVARFVGPRVTIIDGNVAAADDSGVTLGVLQITKADGVEEYWKGEAVTIPKADISTIRLQKLSRTRSAILAGSTLAVAIAVQKAFGGVGALLGTNDKPGQKQ